MGRQALPAVIALLLFALSLGGFVNRSLDPQWFNDDARQQVWPFLRFHDPELFRDDPVVEYYLSCLPLGYQAVYRITAPLIDPRVTSKALPYLTFVALLAGVWVTCRQISGPWAGWLGVFIVVALGSPLEQMGGGLPRSFSTALVALAAAAVVSRRPRLLAATAIAGAAFYPATGVLLGVTLAIYAFVWPGLKARDGLQRSWRAALGITAATAVACLIMLAVPLHGSSRYGGLVTPDEYDRYPEAGPGQRFRSHPAADPPSYPVAFVSSLKNQLADSGVRGPAKGPAAAVVMILMVSVGALVMVRRPISRGLLILYVAGGVGYQAALWSFPLLFWPGRYVNQVSPVLAVVLGAVGAVELVAWARRTGHSDRITTRVTVAAAMPLLLAMALLPGKRSGLALGVHRDQRFFEFMSSLPKDALVAGWPRSRLQSVRLVSARKVLVDYENHLAFHRRYIELMRPRATLSIQASLSHTDEALRRLRSEYGVTHFVYRYWPPPSEPSYFKPFDEVIRETIAARGGRPPAVEGLIDRAAVYRDGRAVVLDLARAFPPTGDDGQEHSTRSGSAGLRSLPMTASR